MRGSRPRCSLGRVDVSRVKSIFDLELELDWGGFPRESSYPSLLLLKEQQSTTGGHGISSSAV